jgi:hypothetical protein
MVLETAELLYTVHAVLNGDSDAWREMCPKTRSGNRGYPSSHESHPCSTWLREHPNNYKATALLGMALAQEFHDRYGKPHGCLVHLKWLSSRVPQYTKCVDIKDSKVKTVLFDAIPVTPLPRCIPAACKNLYPDDAIKAYRLTYMTTKRRLAFWKTPNRGPPSWWKADIKECTPEEQLVAAEIKAKDEKKKTKNTSSSQSRKRKLNNSSSRRQRPKTPLKKQRNTIQKYFINKK